MILIYILFVISKYYSNSTFARRYCFSFRICIKTERYWIFNLLFI